MCCALETPRVLDADWRPGTRTRSTTWVSRAHAPLSPSITQSASGRSIDALIAVRRSMDPEPAARIVALVAMTDRSAKRVVRRSTSMPTSASTSVIVRVSASAGDSLYVDGRPGSSGFPGVIACSW